MNATHEWKVARTSWERSVEVIQRRFEAIGQKSPEMYARRRSLPVADADDMARFLRGGKLFENVNLETYAVAAPRDASKSEPACILAYRRTDAPVVEVIWHFGDVADWQEFYAIEFDLRQYLASTPKGLIWPYGKWPLTMDVSTWPRLVFDVLNSGQFPLRNSLSADGVSEPICMPDVSALVLNHLLAAVEELNQPDDTCDGGFAYPHRNRGLQSSLIWLKPRVSAPPEHKENPIPADKRTKPLKKKDAARHLGQKGNEKRAVEWLNKCIADGIIQYFETSRQSGIYNLDDFAPDKRDALRP